MGNESAIEWTERTWNPTTGCTKLSPGCKHCYAEVMARRLQAMGAPGYERGFKLAIHPRRLEEPLRRKRPTTYFVNSMSDLFHKQVPDAFLDQVFDVIRATPQHTYQVLTKRAERLPEYFAGRACPENVWLGVSVENRRHGVPRIDLLRGIDARVRFLSVEPLLDDVGELDLRGIHWVIVGGESGHGARPMAKAWVENVQRQCEAAGVAFFFKQWGGWGADGVRRSKKANGRELDGRTWDAYPEEVRLESLIS
jgi:protein gp37